MNKSKYYYESDRNKEPIDYSKNSTPSYYIGDKFKYKVKDIIWDFNCSYNIGTATSYLLRSGRKQEIGLTSNEKRIEDLNKAINHIRFEIENLNKGGDE